MIVYRPLGDGVLLRVVSRDDVVRLHAELCRTDTATVVDDEEVLVGVERVEASDVDIGHVALSDAFHRRPCLPTSSTTSSATTSSSSCLRHMNVVWRRHDEASKAFGRALADDADVVPFDGDDAAFDVKNELRLCRQIDCDVSTLVRSVLLVQKLDNAHERRLNAQRRRQLPVQPGAVAEQRRRSPALVVDPRHSILTPS